MTFLDRLERKFGSLAVPGLMTYLVIGQVIVFLFIYGAPQYAHIFYLKGSLVAAGEWWRIFTMLLAPISLSPIWAAFSWYIYYLYGTGLEREWGSFRFTLYLALVYAATVAAAFLFPAAEFGNAYIYSSVFLAFAYLFPDFTLLLFFFIPVKIKWLALLVWAGMAVTFLTGPLSARVLTVLSVSNFLLFFGSDVYRTLTDRSRALSRRSGSVLEGIQTYMQCTVCHATERDRKIFYWCHTCNPDLCYCEDHIKNHAHKIVN